MFDLGSAIVLGLVLVGLVSIARSLAFGTAQERITVLLCTVASFAAVELVAASDFAHDQVLLDRTLDSLNFWSQMVVVVLAVGLASGIWQGVKAISLVGGESHL